MKIQFTGGPLDGIEEDVPPNVGWDWIKKIGVLEPTGKMVIAEYRRSWIELERPLEPGSDVIAVGFEHAKDLKINPGEIGRLIKLPSDP